MSPCTTHRSHMSDKQRDLDLLHAAALKRPHLAWKLRSGHTQRWSATLGKVLAGPKGQQGPPWGQPHFSYLFSSTPPVEVYELAGLL